MAPGPLALCALGLLLTAGACRGSAGGSAASAFKPGQAWVDTDGEPINAHGGGILFGEYSYASESVRERRRTRVSAMDAPHPLLICLTHPDLMFPLTSPDAATPMLHL
jgi:hypothetical protein